MKKITLSIAGMSCQGCANTVQRPSQALRACGGYQIDIFESVPGDEGYTPLSNPHLVTWNETATPRILTSLAELLEAEQNGELTIRPTNVIVNAPVVRWPTDYLGGRSKIENQ